MPLARVDLVEIRKYSIGEFGADVANAYFRGFNKAFSLLRERPFAAAEAERGGGASLDALVRLALKKAARQ